MKVVMALGKQFKLDEMRIALAQGASGYGDAGATSRETKIRRRPSSRALLRAGCAIVLVTVGAGVCWAQTAGVAPIPPASTPDKADTAWMLVCSALVLMMSIPGLALFYGGLVRSKNMLSVLSQVFMIVAMVGIIWVLYGYSLAFGDGGALESYIGGFGKAFLMGVTPLSNVPTFSNGVVIPEFAYMVFQMTFAMITPALIVGSFAERIKFSSLMVFVFLWVTFVYFPIAHWVWAAAAPDDITNAAKALAAATTPAAKAAAQARFNAVSNGAGWLSAAGALDFAGGTVVHIDAGIAGFVGCLFVKPRIGYGRESMAPHSMTMTMIGASLLWVGWFGFNAGSSLEANGTAALAFVNTMVATCAATLSWLFIEWVMKRKPSMLGMASGAVAGLVAITPASGFAGPMGAMALGFIVSPICFFFVSTVKNKFKYDDALDVFGVHCIGGVVGAIGTGILVAPYLGGVGITDYANYAHGDVGVYAMGGQLLTQLKAVLAALIWSGGVSALLYKLVDMLMGLRPSADAEREGLDLSQHGERAYTY